MLKIYISVDMEGVACVTHVDHVKLEGIEYEAARKWMTAEANAAIKGAYKAGATEVIVADSHGHMRNLLPDEVHEDALLVRGSPRPMVMMEGLDETFDAVFLIGYHSMAGTRVGVLSHSFIGSTIYSVSLNGMVVGEPGFSAAIAGHYGVPVALVCGDDTVDTEIKYLMPNAECVITKWGISPTAARNLTPRASQKLIRQGAKRALKRLGEIEAVILEKPINFEVTFFKPINAFLASDIPGIEQIDGRTLAYTGADMLEVTRIWRLIINASLGTFSV